VIDTRRLSVRKTIQLGAGMRPMGTVTAPDGKHVYVTTGRSKMLLTVDTSTDRVAGSVEAGPRPWGVAVSADGQTLYTANGPSNDVSVIDVAAAKVVRRIPVGRGPWGIALVARP
jgi:YVTN family beta-propeller protein